jgi:hypothetical protein
MMDFLKWCAGKNFSPHPKIALQEMWQALAAARVEPAEIRRLMDGLHESFKERRQ